VCLFFRNNFDTLPAGQDCVLFFFSFGILGTALSSSAEWEEVDSPNDEYVQQMDRWISSWLFLVALGILVFHVNAWMVSRHSWFVTAGFVIFIVAAVTHLIAAILFVAKEYKSLCSYSPKLLI